MAEIAVLGFGTVGSGVVELIDRNQEQILKGVPEGIHVKYILDLRDFPDSPYADRVVHDIDIILADPEISVICETMAPFLGIMVTSPSSSSILMASLMGVRLTPSLSPRCTSISLSPAGSSPVSMAWRSLLYTESLNGRKSSSLAAGIYVPPDHDHPRPYQAGHA